MVKDLSAFGIKKVGVSSLSGTVTRTQNDLVYSAMQEFPGIVEGYAFINPKAPDAHDEIDLCLGDYGMNGVKLHPWKHGYYSDNCPQLDDILAHVKKYGRHVQVHVGTSPLCTPFAWVNYAIKHPSLNIVFTHIACREFGYSAIELIKDIGNIWVETSVQYEAYILKKAVQDLGARRMLFGTDWPYKPPNIEIEKLLMLGFDDDDLEYVFYKNAEILWQR
jgi:predicted TIM-barrel fold metal-dependent hydrolase